MSRLTASAMFFVRDMTTDFRGNGYSKNRLIYDCAGEATHVVTTLLSNALLLEKLLAIQFRKQSLPLLIHYFVLGEQSNISACGSRSECINISICYFLNEWSWLLDWNFSIFLRGEGTEAFSLRTLFPKLRSFFQRRGQRKRKRHSKMNTCVISRNL